MRTLDFADGFESAVQPTLVVAPATAVSVNPSGNLSSTNVQAALEELQADVDTRATSDDLSDHAAATSGVHGVSGNVVGTEGSQTLKTKTLEAPVVTQSLNAASATDIDMGTSNTPTDVQIGTGSGGNTIHIGGPNSTVVIQGDTITETSTNKAVTDKLVTLNKGGSAATGGGVGHEIEEGGSVTGYSKTSGDRNGFEYKAPNVAGIVSLKPEATNDEIALLAKQQTLSKKTFSDGITFQQISTPANPLSGFNKIYPKADGKFYTLKSDGTETVVGSGSGGGGVNYITDGDAESVDIFTATKNTIAGPRPDSGFVTPVSYVSTSVSTSVVLSGNNSFRINKLNSNAQGEQVWVPFTVPLAGRARCLDISFNYIAGTTAFAPGSSSSDGDVIVYIAYQDPADSLWYFIEPSSFKLLSNSKTISTEFRATFQTHASALNYKLLFHIASTSTAFGTLYVDSVSVSPVTRTYGSPITDWRSFTPTGSWNTNVVYTGLYRQNGDSAEVQMRATLTGTPNAVPLTMNMPAGLNIDPNKLIATTNFKMPQSGGTALDVGGTGYDLDVLYASATTVVPIVANVASTYPAQSNVTNTIPFTFGNTDYVEISFSAPIVGWSSNVEMSSGANTSLIDSFAGKITGSHTSSSNWQDVTAYSSVSSTNGAMDATTGIYTVYVAGDYSVQGFVNFLSNSTGNARGAKILLNTGGGFAATGIGDFRSVAGGFNTLNANGILRNLKSGDQIKMSAYQDSGGSLGYMTDPEIGTRLSIARMAVSATFAAPVEISCRYYLTTVKSIPNATTTTIEFTSKSWDTHDSYNISTGLFTVFEPGRYRVTGTLLYDSASVAANNQYLIVATQSGSASNTYVLGGTIPSASGTANMAASGSDTFNCRAGDTIAIQGYQTSGASRNLVAGSPQWQHFTIEKVR